MKGQGNSLAIQQCMLDVLRILATCMFNMIHWSIIVIKTKHTHNVSLAASKGMLSLSVVSLCNCMNCSHQAQHVLWNFPGKNTGTGFYFLLWVSSDPRIKPNSCISWAGMWIHYHQHHPGSPNQSSHHIRIYFALALFKSYRI